MQSHVAELGVALTNSAEPGPLALLFRRPARGAAAIFGRAHSRLLGVMSGSDARKFTATSRQGRPWSAPLVCPARGPRKAVHEQKPSQVTGPAQSVGRPSTVLAGRAQ